MEHIFVLEGLDCPNCAAAIEQEVGTLGSVQKSDVNLLNQTLVVQAEGIPADALCSQIEKIVHKHEPKVAVRAKSAVPKAEKPRLNRKKAIRLFVGAALFVFGFIVHSRFRTIGFAVLLLAYILLGYDVIFRAVRNIGKGKLFDELFLMSISTIGAFCIGEYPEGVAVMLFYQIGEWFQDAAVERSRHSISALLDIRPETAVLLRDGETETVPAETVKPGDTLLIRAGERIPLDGTITEGNSTLDTSALTGESLPRRVFPGDSVLSGCINQSGVLKVTATKPFQESAASKIVEMTERAAARKAPAERFITRFAKIYTPAVVGAAVLLAVLPPLFLHGAWHEWLHRALVFLVISCPCALVISVPLTIFGGIGAASRQGVLVKGGNDLETLSRVKTIVFDKTGTLTKGEFRVTGLYAAPPFTEEQLLKYAAVCEQFSDHPIARSIREAYGKAIPEKAVCTELAGYGIRCEQEGTVILAGSAALMEQEQIRYSECLEGGTKVYLAVNGEYCGCIVIADTLKPDCAEAMGKLRKLGITRTVMLTGDTAAAASAIAGELKMDDVYAQLLPGDKVKHVEEMEKKLKKGEKLAFVGDGINDAPVLNCADVGIAMGALGSDAAIEAADIVLMTDAVGKLPEAVRIAGKTQRIVLQNIVFSLGVKGILLIFGALGMAGMWLAVLGDVGVTILAVLNAGRMLKDEKKHRTKPE